MNPVVRRRTFSRFLGPLYKHGMSPIASPFEVMVNRNVTHGNLTPADDLVQKLPPTELPRLRHWTIMDKTQWINTFQDAQIHKRREGTKFHIYILLNTFLFFQMRTFVSFKAKKNKCIYR